MSPIRGSGRWRQRSCFSASRRRCRRRFLGPLDRAKERLEIAADRLGGNGVLRLLTERLARREQLFDARTGKRWREEIALRMTASKALELLRLQIAFDA